MEKKVILQVPVSLEFKAKVEQAAKANERSMAGEVRKAVTEHLKMLAVA